MPDGSRAIPRKRRKKQNSCDGSHYRFDVPGFLQPSSMPELRELAGLMALAGWAPDSYRDIEGNFLRPRIEMAILHGLSVGLGPVAALQSIAVIDGMPTIWGDGAMALVERSGLLEDMSEDYLLDEQEGLTATCTMRRRGRPTPIINGFSMAMAEQARLTVKEGPWQDYPRRMLKMRARSWTIRDGFSDVLRGLHIREEVEDYAPSIGLASPRGISEYRPAPLLRGSPRPRRGCGSEMARIAKGAEPLSHATPSDHAETAKPIADADMIQDGVRADVDEAVPVARAIPDTVTETAEAAPSAEADTLSGDVDRDIIAPEPAEQQYVLVEPDGTVGEFEDTETLRSAFERIAYDNYLPPDQLLGFWESNETARTAIEQRFGPEAVAPVRERLEAAHRTRDGQRDQAMANGNVPPLEQQVPRAAVGHRWAVRRPSRLPRDGATSRLRREIIPDPALVVTMDPTWGHQKIFQHYRARLRELHNDGAGKASLLVSFRQSNSVVEAWLRQKLPELMTQIDALYADAAAQAT